MEKDIKNFEFDHSNNRDGIEEGCLNSSELAFFDQAVVEFLLCRGVNG